MGLMRLQQKFTGYDAVPFPLRNFWSCVIVLEGPQLYLLQVCEAVTITVSPNVAETNLFGL